MSSWSEKKEERDNQELWILKHAESKKALVCTATYDNA